MSLYQKLANYHIKFINEGGKVFVTTSGNYGISYALNSSRHSPSAVSLIVVGTLRMPSHLKINIETKHDLWYPLTK